MAKYKTNAPHFIFDTLVPAGKILTLSKEYEPTPYLEPIDDEAKAAMAAYVAAKPYAQIHPIDALPMTMESPIVEDVPKDAAGDEVDLSLAASQLAIPKPSLSEGGKAVPAPK